MCDPSATAMSTACCCVSYRRSADVPDGSIGSDCRFPDRRRFEGSTGSESSCSDTCSRLEKKLN